MPAIVSLQKILVRQDVGNISRTSHLNPAIEVALLTGGRDPHYALGLATALASQKVLLDVIGSDEMGGAQLASAPRLRFLNLRGGQRLDAGLAEKVSRVLAYYGRLIRYAATAKPKIFHVLWNNKFESFDRTLLMLYYKLLGKKIALTLHNVNAGRRDLNDTVFNRLTLRMQYRLADHLFVHTEKMKIELIKDFNVCERSITVIPYGINNSVPDTGLTSHEAKQRLGIKPDEKTILFFGTIRPYKGIEYLLAAFQRLMTEGTGYRLIIAGESKRESREYSDEIQEAIRVHANQEQIIAKIEYVPDDETEKYFKAADVLVLPYKEIFQSGVLFLGYSFGLPVIASDVGSLKEDIIEGRTGFVCKPSDSDGLAETIEKYFSSDLFKNLDLRRKEIQDYAESGHSWGTVGEMTRNVYAGLLGKQP